MSRPAYLLLAVVALGCKQPNPAFDNVDGGDAVDSQTASEASTGSPAETGSATGEPPDTSDTSDTSEPVTTETGDEPVCEFNTRPPLHLALRTPDGTCPPLLNELALWLEAGTVNAELGMASGSKCDDFACDSCPYEGYAIGAPGFEGLAQTWTVLGEIAAEIAVEGFCVEATVASLVGVADGACIYEAMGIRDNTIEHGPIFIGQVGEAPLSWVATEVLGQQSPTRSNVPAATCSCASVYATSPGELGCCEDAGLEPSFYALELLGLTLEPGQADTLPLQVPWVFHVLQSQVVPTCENPTGKAQLSWAMTRQQ